MVLSRRDNTTVLDSDLYLNEGYLETKEMWKDELQSLIAQQKNNPTDDITTNYAEGTLDFKTSTDENDYAVMNVQLNHSWKLLSELHPHVHWFQGQNATPNWLLKYRWQTNGGAKVSDWTSLPMNSNAFSYSSGTILQISYCSEIVPPSGAQLSDILQLRLIRDNANGSGEFSGADGYTATAAAVNFDVHFQVDMAGSRQEYEK